ncbi:hypothetical protein GP486_001662 [Trichoglossum hirsutum]|uniref:Uncharacterized protein n=1 Tax=Trichoglossum hirsutum TaxID=265104 RepID=A0A9P8LGK0_9PEZI|nr:hypothetical protein GP486_001662 [Trichoglossum hirsutum]
MAQPPKSRQRNGVDFSNEPTLYPLLKEERYLERELRELKSELDTIEQARKIETKGEDEELVGLIEKWKGAARTAAEEVFGRVSDRVNRMGGPAAWKEMQKGKNGWVDEGFGDARRMNGGDRDEGRELDQLRNTDDEASDEDVSTVVSGSTHTPRSGVSVTFEKRNELNCSA